MESPRNQVDKHGFPIPQKFHDEPISSKGGAPSGKARLLWRLMFVLLAVAVVVNSPIGSGVRHWLGQRFVSNAIGKYLADDLSGAIGSFDWALKFSYDDPTVYRFRGQCRLENKDLQGSLDDYNRAIQLDPTDSDGYVDRSIVHHRLKDIDAALSDLDLAVKRRTAHDPNPFNARAYTKAVAGVDLDAALADAEKALEDAGPNHAGVLDTRGFLRCLLGNQQGALEDLDRAIKLTEQRKEHDLDRLSKARRPEKEIAHHTRKLNEMLAVMYHHRGLVYQKQGEPSKAKADTAHAIELGYNPDEGVF